MPIASQALFLPLLAQKKSAFWKSAWLQANFSKASAAIAIQKPLLGFEAQAPDLATGEKFNLDSASLSTPIGDPAIREDSPKRPRLSLPKSLFLSEV